MGWMTGTTLENRQIENRDEIGEGKEDLFDAESRTDA